MVWSAAPGEAQRGTGSSPTEPARNRTDTGRQAIIARFRPEFEKLLYHVLMRSSEAVPAPAALALADEVIE